ncbi:MAG: gamma-glutamylcyclotransferase [Alphaproteobacteria bacterium]|nr:gamma-glutamylcyclotransferase [Alphaproteobacteria bacterium]
MVTWIFGYGSLIPRPDFPYVERQAGFIQGWSRRFWQGSTDHRGVPGAPGRVVTLTPSPGERCWGVAYAVDPAHRDATLARLDHREKGGYAREVVAVHRRTGAPIHGALVYLATPENPNYLGPASLDEIARTIARSVGPSGPNLDYLLHLEEGLRALEVEDPHVFELARITRRLIGA